MAALDVITRILKPGDEVIAGDDLYGGTNRLLSYIKVHMGVTVYHVDTTDTKAVTPFLSSKTSMVLLESPTNPLLKIADLAEIILEVRARCPDAVVVVDNTMMSPYLQRPLEMGADLVYDSGTKYLSGHHDLMAGVITCNRDDLAKVYIYLSHILIPPNTDMIHFTPPANGSHHQLDRKCANSLRFLPSPPRYQNSCYPHGPSTSFCHARRIIPAPARLPRQLSRFGEPSSTRCP